MPIKVLVVEDDFANQRVASLFLKKLGYLVDIAENGHKALEMVVETNYHLVFMDCQMPLMDGFEAARQIRKIAGHNQQVPIIALTANVVCGIQADCRDAGMNDVLSKPVQLDKMKEMLENWIKVE